MAVRFWQVNIHILAGHPPLKQRWDVAKRCFYAPKFLELASDQEIRNEIRIRVQDRYVPLSIHSQPCRT